MDCFVKSQEPGEGEEAGGGYPQISKSWVLGCILDHISQHLCSDKLPFLNWLAPHPL